MVEWPHLGEIVYIFNKSYVRCLRAGIAALSAVAVCGHHDFILLEVGGLHDDTGAVGECELGGSELSLLCGFDFAGSGEFGDQRIGNDLIDVSLIFGIPDVLDVAYNLGLLHLDHSLLCGFGHYNHLVLFGDQLRKHLVESLDGDCRKDLLYNSFSMPGEGSLSTKCRMISRARFSVLVLLRSL